MNRQRMNWPLIIGGGVLAGLVLVACLWVAWLGMSAFLTSRTPQPSEHRSNGAQIYLTSTSQRGTPITSDFRMGMMGRGRVACVTCHGPDGRGGQVRMMMRAFDAPDIGYETLTSEEHGEEDEHEHEPWTDETIKRAITEGVEPNGKPLDWQMPRWTMSEADLHDLLDFLKTLD